MERVALVVEATGERLRCLLNPERLVMRRRAGVRARTTGRGGLAGPGLRDDPLLYSGGGYTELELDLLFDTELDDGPLRPVETASAPEAAVAATALSAAPPGAPAPRDVRELTAALWQLAETPVDAGPGQRVHARLVRFVWGKAWNVPGVITSVAEHLERFGPEGQPTRSWLRLRLVRVDEPALAASDADTSPLPPPDTLLWPAPDAPIPAGEIELREPLGELLAGAEGGAEPVLVRPDLWSAEVYGTPFLWRLYATFSGLDDPLFPGVEAPVRFPPRSAVTSRSTETLRSSVTARSAATPQPASPGGGEAGKTIR
jgi:hypothetical protein